MARDQLLTIFHDDSLELLGTLEVYARQHIVRGTFWLSVVRRVYQVASAGGLALVVHISDFNADGVLDTWRGQGYPKHGGRRQILQATFLLSSMVETLINLSLMALSMGQVAR